MQLVLFTSHYPYGNGEPFLEEEIRVAENKFQTIYIISYAKEKEVLTRYIPQNAKVISLRKEGKNSFIVTVIKFLFTSSTWREIVFGCKERGYGKIIRIAKQIFLTLRHIVYLQNNKEVQKIIMSREDKKIFYSYWLNPAALFITQNKYKTNGITIARTHGGDCFFDREYIPWRKEILRDIDYVFSISEAGKQDIIRHNAQTIKDLEEKIIVSKLGVRVPCSSIERTLSEQKRIIISCSNIIKLKRLDLLICALGQIDDIDIHWIHFGDGPLKKEMEKLSSDILGTKKNISYEFFGGVCKEVILDYYKKNQVDLFINCSDAEGIPVSIMEAMSYSIPVIARNVGGVSEIVDDECGLLLPGIISAEDLAVGIRSLLCNTNSNQYAAKSYNCFCKINKEYNTNSNYSHFYDMIKECNTHDAQKK